MIETYSKLLTQLLNKRTLIFFVLFFSVPFLFVYVQARSENRSSYNFVVTEVSEHGNGIKVFGKKSGHFFCNFDLSKSKIEVGDSISKNAFSKKLKIFRKDFLTNNYKIYLELNESGNFPIDWQ